METTQTLGGTLFCRRRCAAGAGRRCCVENSQPAGPPARYAAQSQLTPEVLPSPLRHAHALAGGRMTGTPSG